MGTNDRNLTRIANVARLAPDVKALVAPAGYTALSSSKMVQAHLNVAEQFDLSEKATEMQRRGRAIIAPYLRDDQVLRVDCRETVGLPSGGILNRWYSIVPLRSGSQTFAFLDAARPMEEAESTGATVRLLDGSTIELSLD